jgi:outer membrane protein TolC
LLLCLCLLASAAFAAEPATGGEILSLERCLDIAVRSHPAILRDGFVVRQKEAVVGQAQARYYPRIDLSAQYTRNNAIVDYRDPYFPWVGKTYNQNIGNATLNQMIFDFGRTPTDVKSKRFDADSSRFSLDDTVTSVTLNVKAAYYNVLRARRSRGVAVETVDQYRLHLRQARDYFAAGKRPHYDVTRAELDVSNADLQLIVADNDLKIAWVQLNNAMGIDERSRYDIEDTLGFREYAIGLDEALERAYANRPDLKALVAQRDAAAMATERARSDYWPSLSGSAGYSAQGSSYPLSQGWNAGVTMTMNVFEGMLTKNRVDEGKAKTLSMEAQISARKLDILLDVKQAYLNLVKARESIANTEVQIRQATENLEITNLRYNAALATPVDVTDAVVSYSNAKLANVTALYNYKVAQANIEKAMGSK